MKRQQKTVAFITLIIILTIGIQAYWNYIQYANNRLQVINEIQSVLDKVTKEYTELHPQDSLLTHEALSEIVNDKNEILHNFIDGMLDDLKNNKPLNSINTEESSITYELVLPSIDLKAFDKMLSKELKKNKYDINYNLTKTENGKVTDSLGNSLDSLNILNAKSQLAPFDSIYTINLNYSDPILPSLLKGLMGIILSFVLCCAVIFALIYLLQIIKKQKEISEIKNDFISNVTHEFKTPIATVSSALEAIKNFNNENITEKTKRYLDISEHQLKKLNYLVEKVMETSLIESSALHLEFEKTDIINLIKGCAERHQLNTNKIIHFKSSFEYLELSIDEFHFENAVSNLIDNAIKYGGNEINISISNDNEEGIVILINDNGEGISKEDEPFIFDKFFRTKTKNIHNIKGFGIGLYYTKNIFEKHKGTIVLKNRNTFIITL